MHNMLQIIIREKRKDLLSQATKRFKEAILSAQGTALIGELKFASPINAHISSKNSLETKAKEYEKAGISAISVITEKHFFKGDCSFIPRVKKAVKIPILQKDFVIDMSQIYEAKALGSDALLFIARIVSRSTLQQFVRLAKNLGIEPVVEVASNADLQKAILTQTDIIAVNARDLDTFTINVEKACSLIHKVPTKFIRLGFSGIKSAKDIAKYKKAGARGVLIGTSLMKAEHVNDFIKNLTI